MKNIAFLFKFMKTVLSVLGFLVIAVTPLSAETEDASSKVQAASGKQGEKNLTLQKIYIFGGLAANNNEVVQIGHSSVLQLEHQFEFLKEKWSISYINEGQFSDPKHHRDGLIGQYWFKKGCFSAGAGGYFYYDTTEDGSNVHGLGGILSLNGELPITANLSANLRTNFIFAREMNTFSLLAGLSYNFAPEKIKENKLHEITIFPVGGSFSSAISADTSYAYAGEYRLNVYKNLDWSIGYLDEKERNGIYSQLWAIKKLEKFSIGIGAGVYFADNTDIIISITGNYDLTENLSIRATWSRITTGNNNDADVPLLGLGYKF